MICLRRWEITVSAHPIRSAQRALTTSATLLSLVKPPTRQRGRIYGAARLVPARHLVSLSFDFALKVCPLISHFIYFLL